MCSEWARDLELNLQGQRQGTSPFVLACDLPHTCNAKMSSLGKPCSNRYSLQEPILENLSRGIADVLLLAVDKIDLWKCLLAALDAYEVSIVNARLFWFSDKGIRRVIQKHGIFPTCI